MQLPSSKNNKKNNAKLKEFVVFSAEKVYVKFYIIYLGNGQKIQEKIYQNYVINIIFYRKKYYFLQDEILFSTGQNFFFLPEKFTGF